MKLLNSHIDEAGIDRTDLVVTADIGLEFVGPKTTVSGASADEYMRVVTGIKLVRGADDVMTIPPGSDMFVQTAEALRRSSGFSFYSTLVDRGSKPPAEAGVFSIAYKRLQILAKADEDFVKALISDDNARFEEIAWTKFQQFKIFEKSPCSRELFDELRAEFAQSRFPVSMNFTDYYEWFRETEKFLGPDGALKPEIKQQAERMLDAWSGSTEIDNKYWLNRNLDVHPRLRPLFDALVDARANVEPPLAPTP